MTKLKNSGQVNNSPNYKNILHEYWNNGTHQVENPDPITEDAAALASRNNRDNTPPAANKDTKDYLENVTPGNQL